MKQSMRVSRAISVLFTVVVPEYSHFCIITYSKNQFRIKLFRTNRTNSEQNNLISDAVDERKLLSFESIFLSRLGKPPERTFLLQFFPQAPSHSFFGMFSNGQKITPRICVISFFTQPHTVTGVCISNIFQVQNFNNSKNKKKPTKSIYRIEKFKVIVTVPNGIF